MSVMGVVIIGGCSATQVEGIYSEGSFWIGWVDDTPFMNDARENTTLVTENQILTNPFHFVSMS